MKVKHICLFAFFMYFYHIKFLQVSNTISILLLFIAVFNLLWLLIVWCPFSSDDNKTQYYWKSNKVVITKWITFLHPPWYGYQMIGYDKQNKYNRLSNIISNPKWRSTHIGGSSVASQPTQQKHQIKGFDKWNIYNLIPNPTWLPTQNGDSPISLQEVIRGTGITSRLRPKWRLTQGEESPRQMTNETNMNECIQVGI